MKNWNHWKSLTTVLLVGSLATVAVYVFSTTAPSILAYPNRKCDNCNRQNFSFWDTPLTKCGSSEVFLLNIIVSHPNNVQARTSIRKTWASVQSHKNHSIKSVFVLGKTGFENTDKAVMKEGETFNDIIVVDMQESYFKLTEKTLAVLEWTLQRCQQFRYILKTDDDTFNNPWLLLDFIASHGYPEDFVSGVCELQATVRKNTNKWSVSQEEYSGYYLPYFCKGPVYILAHKTAAAFHNLSPNVMYFKLEDVFLTGFVRQEYGLEPLQLPGFHRRPQLFSPCYAPQVHSMHRVEPNYMQEYWNYATDPASRPYRCIYIYQNRKLICAIMLFFIVIFLYWIKNNRSQIAMKCPNRIVFK